jgi:signal transduction histidine kinase
MGAIAESKAQVLNIALPKAGIITTDLVRFRQVLYNLIANALKYTPPKGQVDVIAEWIAHPAADAPVVECERALALRVHVRDTGFGILPADRERIWEEFHQLRGGMYQSHDGTGLGLSLTRRLLKLMEGEIWFESVPNKGSTFSFYLPVRPQAAATDGCRRQADLSP